MVCHHQGLPATLSHALGKALHRFLLRSRTWRYQFDNSPDYYVSISGNAGNRPIAIRPETPITRQIDPIFSFCCCNFDKLLVVITPLNNHYILSISFLVIG